MKLSTKVAYNTIIQIISKLIATLLGLLAVAFITRYLGREGFGEYTTVMTFLSFFAILADLGLTLVTVQMISRPGADQDKILGNLLGLRLISGIIFIGAAPIAILFFPYAAAVKIGVAIAALNFLFIALNQIFVGLFQKHLRMDKVSIAEVVSRAVLVLCAIAAIKLNWGLAGILAATVTAGGVNFILHYYYSRSFSRVKLFFDFIVWKEILSRTWPLALTILLNLIYLRGDILLLSLINRTTKIGIIAEVGIYGAAYKVIDVLITFPYVFIGIILPILTACWTRRDKKAFNNILQKAFEIMVIFAIPLLVGAQFTAKNIVILVAGNSFALAGPILRILIVAASLIYISVIFAHAIIAIDKWKKVIPAYLVAAITAVAGYLLLIPHFSYWGAAWITIYSEIFILLAQVYYLKKFTGFLPNLNILLKTSAAAGVMALAIYTIKLYLTNNLYIILLSAILIYSIFIFIFKGLSKKDILSLFNK
ncbi:MAG: flippase [Patescibacteria group bacterium]|nr:flippase [Patescibacteria group bacterium]